MKRSLPASLGAVLLSSLLPGCAAPTTANVEIYALPNSPDAIAAYRECQRRSTESSGAREAWLGACVRRIPEARKVKEVSSTESAEAAAPPECIYFDSDYLGHGPAYVYLCSR